VSYPVSNLERLSAFGSGEIMSWDLGTFVQVFGMGISIGFVMFVVISLLGFGIYKAIKMLDS